MAVHCNDTNCIHNKNGKCENVYPLGQKAIELRITSTGYFICKDQEWRDDDAT